MAVKQELCWQRYTLKFGEKTLIMGILNVTPDSFSDGGQFNSLERAIARAKQMAAEGADIIDIGGESTRPGSTEVDAEEEMRRILPVVERLHRELALPISVDTSKSCVAEAALSRGAAMVNDVWGLQRDAEMACIVAAFGVPVIVMHNQHGTTYKTDIMTAINDFLRRSLNIGVKAGISEELMIIDPGIGFGKTPEQNLEVMARLHELTTLGRPILLGTSRKSMIGKILDLPPEERVEGTIATTALGIASSVDIVRVHDVRANARAAAVADAILRRRPSWIAST